MLKSVHPEQQGETQVTFDINGKDYTYNLDTDIANHVVNESKYKPGAALDTAKKNDKSSYENIKDSLNQAIKTDSKRIEHLESMVKFNESLTHEEISQLEKEVNELRTVVDYNQRKLTSL
jgi:hypothetical protein